MAESSSGSNSAVPIVAIIVIGALVLFFAWYFMVREGTAPAPTQTETAPPAATKSDSDIDIKVDLPDSVIIK